MKKLVCRTNSHQYYLVPLIPALTKEAGSDNEQQVGVFLSKQGRARKVVKYLTRLGIKLDNQLGLATSREHVCFLVLRDTRLFGRVDPGTLEERIEAGEMVFWPAARLTTNLPTSTEH